VFNLSLKCRCNGQEFSFDLPFAKKTTKIGNNIIILFLVILFHSLFIPCHASHINYFSIYGCSFEGCTVHRRMLKRTVIIYVQWPILLPFLQTAGKTINTVGYCIYATSIREMEISCFTSPYGLNELNLVLPRANTTSAFLFAISISCRNEVVLSSLVMRRSQHFLLRYMYSRNR